MKKILIPFLVAVPLAAAAQDVVVLPDGYTGPLAKAPAYDTVNLEDLISPTYDFTGDLSATVDPATGGVTVNYVGDGSDDATQQIQWTAGAYNGATRAIDLGLLGDDGGTAAISIDASALISPPVTVAGEDIGIAGGTGPDDPYIITHTPSNPADGTYDFTVTPDGQGGATLTAPGGTEWTYTVPAPAISGNECNQTVDDGGIYTPQFGTTTTRRFLPNALGNVTEVLSHDDLASLPLGITEISVIEYEITNLDCATREYVPVVTMNIQYGNIGPDVYLWSGVDGSSPVGFSGAGVMSIDNRGNPDPYFSGHQSVNTNGGAVILAPGQSATFRSAAYVWIFATYPGPSVGVPPGSQAMALANHIMQIRSSVVDDNPVDVFGGAGGNP